MKKWKEAILVMLCLCMILSTTACGARDNNTNNKDNQVNDVTNGTDDSKDNVVDDIGDTIGEGVDDMGNAIGDGVEDITDDLSGNNNQAKE